MHPICVSHCSGEYRWLWREGASANAHLSAVARALAASRRTLLRAARSDVSKTLQASERSRTLDLRRRTEESTPRRWPGKLTIVTTHRGARARGEHEPRPEHSARVRTNCADEFQNSSFYRWNEYLQEATECTRTRKPQAPNFEPKANTRTECSTEAARLPLAGGMWRGTCVREASATGMRRGAEWTSSPLAHCVSTCAAPRSHCARHAYDTENHRTEAREVRSHQNCSGAWFRSAAFWVPSPTR